MTKVHKPGSQNPEKNTPKTSNAKQSTGQPVQQSSAAKAQSPASKGKQSGKSPKSRVGGTAVPGAKSTQPREVNTSNSMQQQAESYNREMRRRMQHLGTGPYNENSAPMEQQRKRLEKRKKRIEERKQEVKKVAATGPSRITLGRRNTYFLIGAVVLLIVIIALFIILRHPFG